jgi:hypothetical protein
MGTDGLGKKLALAAVAVGGILLVLRIVGGRGSDGLDEDAIDRVDTGRSDEERGGGPVETGLERVSTADEEDGDTSADADEDGSEDDEASVGESDDAEERSGSEELSVEATGGRFDDLDLFDFVAIAGAAFEAAREEYRDRT